MGRVRSSFPLQLRERIHCGHVSIFWSWKQTRVQDGLLDGLSSGTMRVRVVRQTDVACSKKPQFVVSPHAAAVQGAFEIWTETTGNAYNMLRSVNVVLPIDCCVLPSATLPQDPARNTEPAALRHVTQHRSLGWRCRPLTRCFWLITCKRKQ